MIQAGVYSVRDALTSRPCRRPDRLTSAVAAKMVQRRSTISSPKAKIRDDGRFEHDMYRAEVKQALELKGPWII